MQACESIDISVTSHLVVFSTIVEDGLHMSVFLNILEIANGTKDAQVYFEEITYCIYK
jgi:hypothetical protein